MNGIINIYKERGYTSHDVVARLRGITHQRKMGHTGTLDPDAEGVLPVCLGTATRVCEIITDHSKCYETVMLLGIATDSQDITGNMTQCAPEGAIEALSRDNVIDAIMSFVGEYDQIPPMFSAVRLGGQRLYEIARAGREIDREPRRVEINSIEIVSDVVKGMLSDDMPFESFYPDSCIRKIETAGIKSDRRFGRFCSGENGPKQDKTCDDGSEAGNGIPDQADSINTADHPVIRVAFNVNCSKGTFIRTLCNDIGEKLGVYGCVERLMRTRVNIFKVDDSITLSQAEELFKADRLEEKLTGVEALFDGYARLDVKEKYDDLLSNGNQLYFRHFRQYITEAPSPVRVYSSRGEMLGIYEYVEGRQKYTPVKVFIEKDD